MIAAKIHAYKLQERQDIFLLHPSTKNGKAFFLMTGCKHLQSHEEFRKTKRKLMLFSVTGSRTRRSSEACICQRPMKATDVSRYTITDYSFEWLIDEILFN